MIIDEGNVLENPTPFIQLVETLTYLTIAIARLNISHAIYIISQFQQSPRTCIWELLSGLFDMSRTPSPMDFFYHHLII